MHTETDVITPELKPFQCRHIKTDGLRCRSACLRHEQFCYFHHTTRAPIQNPRERKAALGRREAFSLHLVEDRSSIQLAIAASCSASPPTSSTPAAPASSSTASRSRRSTSPPSTERPQPPKNPSRTPSKTQPTAP